MNMAAAQAPAVPVPESAPAEQAPESQGDAVILPRLRGIVVTKQAAFVQEGRSSVDGIVVEPSFGAVQSLLDKALAGYLQAPLSVAGLRRIEKTVTDAFKATGRPFVIVATPEQDVTDGVVQILVTLARIGDIEVVGADKFSEESYRSQLRARPGEEIDAQQLEEDLAWMSRGGYRSARIVAEPGERPGETILKLEAVEGPARSVNFGLNDNGSRDTGEWRQSYGVTVGNLMRRAQSLSYNLSSSPDFERSVSHFGSYATDLPWRHELSLSASHSRSKPEILSLFEQVGTVWTVTAAYSIPKTAPRVREAWSVAAEFKRTENDLQFGGLPANSSASDIAQLRFGHDRQASVRPWLFLSTSVAGVMSPGGLSDRNSDESFRQRRANAEAEYAYLTASLAASILLPWGLESHTAMDAQLASGPLMPEVQFNLTGSNAVRAFESSEYLSDQGLLIRQELRSPARAIIGGDGPFVDTLRGYAFGDFATGHRRKEVAPDTAREDFASAGIGLNYSVGRYFSLRAEYAWQLENEDYDRRRDAREHVIANVTVPF